MRPDFLLSAQSLVVGYESPLLKPIHFSVYAGDLICLMGINGCGKTTLFKTLGAQLPALSGEINLKNQNLHSLSSREKAKLMSFVLAGRRGDDHLRVEDVLILGRYPYTNFWGELQKKDWELIEETIELVGLSETRHKILGELSDGQRQKVWIARAFVQDTPILFLDEPTNFLDIPHRLEIMRLLRVMARERGKAVIFSSHDWDCALSAASWLWLIHEGELCMGLPEDFILNGKIQEVFSRKDFIFDSERGVFKEKNCGAQKLSITFKDISFERKHWTLHALGKIGFDCISEDDSQIVVDKQGWTVKTEKGPRLCQSLEELLNTLGRF